MAFTATQINTRVTELIQEDASTPILTSAILGSSLGGALNLYSQDFPRRVREDFLGNATSFYKLNGTGAVITFWIPGLSRIHDLRFPWNPALPAASLEPDTAKVSDASWFVSSDAVGLGALTVNVDTLVFRSSVKPTAAQTVALVYTAPHIVNGYSAATQTSVPDNHFEAFCQLTSYFAASTFASRYLHTSRGTLSLDTVDYQAKGNAWSQRATEFFDAYRLCVGLQGWPIHWPVQLAQRAGMR